MLHAYNIMKKGSLIKAHTFLESGSFLDTLQGKRERERERERGREEEREGGRKRERERERGRKGEREGGREREEILDNHKTVDGALLTLLSVSLNTLHCSREMWA